MYLQNECLTEKVKHYEYNLEEIQKNNSQVEKRMKVNCLVIVISILLIILGYTLHDHYIG